jgi:hypothetical protein
MYYGQLSEGNVATFGGVAVDLGATRIRRQKGLALRIAKLRGKKARLVKKKNRATSKTRRRYLQSRIDRLDAKIYKMKLVLKGKRKYRGSKQKFDSQGQPIVSEAAMIPMDMEADALMTDSIDEIDDFADEDFDAMLAEEEGMDTTTLALIGIGVLALGYFAFGGKKKRANRKVLGKARKNTRRRRKSSKRRKNRR